MAVNSPGANSQVSFSMSSGRLGSRRGSKCDVTLLDDSKTEMENYFKLCKPKSPPATNTFSKSPSQSVKRKVRPRCKDLSHYNSVPPLGHMSRSSSNSFSPSLPLKSPTDITGPPKSPRSYNIPSPSSPRCTPKSPDPQSKSPRFTPKSPQTPSSNYFNFPPSPSFTMKSPGTSKQRKFSFSGPKSPKSPLKSPKSPSTLARSPSIGSTTDTKGADDECSTMATSLSRPSSPRGLAYLASRRGSRESQMSNEELAPLNFTNTVRGRQRRTSNFLELPGECRLC